MTKQEIYRSAYAQLALDMSCTPADMESDENVYCLKAYMDGRRLFESDSGPLNVMCINNKVIFSGTEELIQWCRESYDQAAKGRFSSFNNLRLLDARLGEDGHSILDTHCFFLPSGMSKLEESPYVHWYEGEELERFRGNARFSEALTFVDLRPDMLAVTAEKDGRIFAMAGVSADSESLWQIGINVEPEARGSGLGTYLTTLMKDEVLRRGKTPYYGCAFSHSVSQRIAVGAGFLPVWSEVYTK